MSDSVSDKADLAANGEQRLSAAGSSTQSTDLLKGQASKQQYDDDDVQA